MGAMGQPLGIGKRGLPCGHASMRWQPGAQVRRFMHVIGHQGCVLMISPQLEVLPGRVGIVAVRMDVVNRLRILSIASDIAGQRMSRPQQ